MVVIAMLPLALLGLLSPTTLVLGAPVPGNAWTREEMAPAPEFAAEDGEGGGAALDRSPSLGSSGASTSTTWDEVRPHLSTSERVEHFVVGAVDSGVDTAKGMLHGILHPLKTMAGAGHAIMHPGETYHRVSEDVAEAFHQDPARAAGYTLGTVAQMAYPVYSEMAGVKGAVNEATSKAATVAHEQTLGRLGKVMVPSAEAEAAMAEVASAQRALQELQAAKTATPEQLAEAHATLDASRARLRKAPGGMWRRLGGGVRRVGRVIFFPAALVGKGLSAVGNGIKAGAGAATNRVIDYAITHVPAFNKYILDPTKKFYAGVDPAIRAGARSASVPALMRNGEQVE